MNVVHAGTELARLKQFFTILDETPLVLRRWEQLLAQYQVIGKNAHDAHLVAAMLTHGLGRLLTFNIKDFQRYNGITLVSPEDAVGLRASS